jgi:hypothetical protein
MPLHCFILCGHMHLIFVELFFVVASLTFEKSIISIMQDDSYIESYISTIGVDFVS